MDRLFRRGEFGDAASGRAMLHGLRAGLSALASVLGPSLGPREPSLSALSDRQLRDLGLTRDDVGLPQDRMSAADRDILRLLQGLGWR